MSWYLLKVKDNIGIVHQKEVESDSLDNIIEEYIQEIVQDNSELFVTDIDFEYLK